jgi:hypothetical protein
MTWPRTERLQNEKSPSAFADTVSRTEILIESQIGQIVDGKIPLKFPWA